MYGWFKISSLSFKSQSNQFAGPEALPLKSLVIVAASHTNSVAVIVESDNRYTHKFYVDSANAVPWFNGWLSDAKAVFSKLSLLWQI